MASCVALRKWRWAAWMVLCVAAHLPWFLASPPRNPVAPSASTTSFRITLAHVLTSNLRHGEIIAALRAQNADVLVIVELSSSLAICLSRELREPHPYEIAQPQGDGNFGIRKSLRSAAGSSRFPRPWAYRTVTIASSRRIRCRPLASAATNRAMTAFDKLLPGSAPPACRVRRFP